MCFTARSHDHHNPSTGWSTGVTAPPTTGADPTALSLAPSTTFCSNSERTVYARVPLGALLNMRVTGKKSGMRVDDAGSRGAPILITNPVFIEKFFMCPGLQCRMVRLLHE